MIFKILCYTCNDCCSLIPTAVHIRRLHVQFICNIWNVTKISCEYPIVVSSIEICFCSISGKNCCIYLTICPMIVVQEIVYTSDSSISCHPEGIDLRCLGSKISCSNSPESCCDCPWSTISHNFCDIQPILSLKC